jgi:hypothetical protein
MAKIFVSTGSSYYRNALIIRVARWIFKIVETFSNLDIRTDFSIHNHENINKIVGDLASLLIILTPQILSNLQLVGRR